MVRAGHAVNNTDDYAAAQKVFRLDVYRAAFAGPTVPLPGASAKLEGGIAGTMGVGTVQGRLLLGPDQLFDRRPLVPAQMARYLRQIDSCTNFFRRRSESRRIGYECVSQCRLWR